MNTQNQIVFAGQLCNARVFPRDQLTASQYRRLKHGFYLFEQMAFGYNSTSFGWSADCGLWSRNFRDDVEETLNDEDFLAKPIVLKNLGDKLSGYNDVLRHIELPCIAVAHFMHKTKQSPDGKLFDACFKEIYGMSLDSAKKLYEQFPRLKLL